MPQKAADDIFPFFNDQPRQRMYNDAFYQKDGFGAVDTCFKQYTQ